MEQVLTLTPTLTIFTPPHSIPRDPDSHAGVVSPDFNFLLTKSYLAKRAEKLAAAAKMAEQLQESHSSRKPESTKVYCPPTKEEREARVTNVYYGRNGLYELCFKGDDGIAVVGMKAVARGHAKDSNTTCDMYFEDGRHERVSAT